MPTPDRTSVAEIVRAGRDLLESRGAAGLIMQAVAERVGVRAPSLYKRVRNREELVVLITEATADDLGALLASAADDLAGADALAAMARAIRVFAHERPVGFALVFSSGVAMAQPVLARVAAPVLRASAALVGQERALDAARTFTAWAHGFLTMELGGGFTLGGDVDRAYEYGVTVLTDALRGRGASPTPADG
ncbi:TetR/AcrR family transcriptional regulator [Actinosynnema mirum]|uniref:Regulatory protein TetR n=1 Tax=Actinosynnema mirum (strain ATCC 29888 / DSM 43827 / JCM 3225 / NBRC 14064 / NCIMB 13271 / NRRL B-12336 / IMRU 3971 / 101) TaxID=446462 RepID=C6WNX5_ACTMD|nr:TetR/AcrR family transcriptional regulator [Actinosynnema mirum]ACU36644.1 regulatory protein TetR [Actinosynnema mirum DSM 43827]